MANSWAMLSGSGGPVGPIRLATGFPISAKNFSKPAGVNKTSTFPGFVPMFSYL
jgi:hypothetical protein